MSDNAATQPDENEQLIEELRRRTGLLEAEYQRLRDESTARLIRAEMKAEALQAGMIDLDCLQLLDLSELKVNEKGEVADAAGAIARLKRSKPWMFAAPSSSSLSTVPSVQPSRQKRATEMTDSEYAVARAALLKQSQ